MQVSGSASFQWPDLSGCIGVTDLAMSAPRSIELNYLRTSQPTWIIDIFSRRRTEVWFDFAIKLS